MLWLTITAVLLCYPSERPANTPDAPMPAAPSATVPRSAPDFRAPTFRPGMPQSPAIAQDIVHSNGTDADDTSEKIDADECDELESRRMAEAQVQRLRAAISRLKPTSAGVTRELERLRRGRRRLPDGELRTVVERLMQRAIVAEDLTRAAGAAVGASAARVQSLALAAREQQRSLSDLRAVLSHRDAWRSFRGAFEDNWRDSGKGWEDFSGAVEQALTQEEVLAAVADQNQQVRSRLSADEGDSREEDDRHSGGTRRKSMAWAQPVVLTVGMLTAAFAVLRNLARPARR